MPDRSARDAATRLEMSGDRRIVPDTASLIHGMTSIDAKLAGEALLEDPATVDLSRWICNANGPICPDGTENSRNTPSNSKTESGKTTLSNWRATATSIFENES